ncbi:MAG: amidohydrolase family protein, partial [Candidatus Binatia bacterium]
EHASLVPPPLVDEIARLGAIVVTHPIFADEFAAKYRDEVPEEQRDWLYPMGAWRRAGVLVALGSDAPIASADPLKNLSAARRRGIDGAEALDHHTRGGAYAAHDEGELGEIRLGGAADFVVLESDPTEADPDPALIAIEATVVAGEVAYER